MEDVMENFRTALGQVMEERRGQALERRPTRIMAAPHPSAATRPTQCKARKSSPRQGSCSGHGVTRHIRAGPCACCTPQRSGQTEVVADPIDEPVDKPGFLFPE